jgi:SAM-dependent methyltransferase
MAPAPHPDKPEPVSVSIEVLLRHFCPNRSLTILDLGCGKGGLVMSLLAEGHDAYGCDIADSAASDFRPSPDADRLRAIETHPYRLPFIDGQFDCVISTQVLEHVMDLESTFREIHRVLKPGGISLHTFPGRHVPVEPHVFVPFATVIRNHIWLYLWAALGVRNRFQAGKTAAEVARLNYAYLHAHTNYPPKSQILDKACCFSEAAFREDVFFLPGPEERKHRSMKKRLFVRLGGDRLRTWFHGTFVMRALYLRK